MTLAARLTVQQIALGFDVRRGSVILAARLVERRPIPTRVPQGSSLSEPRRKAA